jgi:hypothetical protein
MNRFKILKNPSAQPCYAPVEAEPLTKADKTRRVDGVRNAIVSRFIQTAEGRQRLAQSMAAPLRIRIDSNSLARRLFHVEELPQGAMPFYDRLARFPESGDTPIQVVNQEGVVQSVSSSNSIIYIPRFSIQSNPQIPLSQIRAQGFNLIDRAQDLAVQEIHRGEDMRAFWLLESAVRTENRIVRVGENFSDGLHDAISAIEDQEIQARNIFINSRDFSQFQHLPELEHAPSRPELGHPIAQLWDLSIFVSQLVPQGYIYITAEPEKVGLLPIVRDIEVLNADDPSNLNIGFLISETIGMCCNPMGVIRLDLR